LRRQAFSWGWFMSATGLTCRLIWLCLQGCISAMTKYTAIMHTFTGKDFVGSANRAFAVLRRNFIGAYITDSVGHKVLSLGVYVFTLTISLLAWYWLDGTYGWGLLSSVTTGVSESADNNTWFMIFMFGLMLWLCSNPILTILLIVVVIAPSMATVSGLVGENNCFIRNDSNRRLNTDLSAIDHTPDLSAIHGDVPALYRAHHARTRLLTSWNPSGTCEIAWRGIGCDAWMCFAPDSSMSSVMGFFNAVFIGCVANLIFSYMAHIILDTVDTVFLSWAIDQDNNATREGKLASLIAQSPHVPPAVAVMNPVGASVGSIPGARMGQPLVQSAVASAAPPVSKVVPINLN